jgi:hypothetical protein
MITTNQSNTILGPILAPLISQAFGGVAFRHSAHQHDTYGGVWSPSTPDVDVSSHLSVTSHGIGARHRLTLELHDNVSPICLTLAWPSTLASILVCSRFSSILLRATGRSPLSCGGLCTMEIVDEKARPVVVSCLIVRDI